MAPIFEQLAFWIEQLIVGLGYIGIAIVMLIENVFPPIPSELVMPLAGFFAADGKFSFAGVWVAGTVGSVMGALVLYYVGYWANRLALRYLITRYGRWVGLSVHDVDRALHAFARHGDVIVFVGRLIPIIRSLISIPAGMQRMPLGRFLVFTAAGSAIWTGVLTYAGMLFGQNWSQVLGVLKTYQNATAGALAGSLALFTSYKLIRRMRRRGATATQSGYTKR